MKCKYLIRGADFITYGGKEVHVDFNILDEKDNSIEKIFTGPLKVANEKVLDIFCIKTSSDPIVKVKKLYIKYL